MFAAFTFVIVIAVFSMSTCTFGHAIPPHLWLRCRSCSCAGIEAVFESERRDLTVLSYAARECEAVYMNECATRQMCAQFCTESCTQFYGRSQGQSRAHGLRHGLRHGLTCSTLRRCKSLNRSLQRAIIELWSLFFPQSHLQLQELGLRRADSAELRVPEPRPAMPRSTMLEHPIPRVSTLKRRKSHL
jgi:hypothetical protein